MSTPKDQPTSLSLLHRAHSPTTAQRLHTEKVTQRPLHLKPTPSTTNAQLERRALRTSRRAEQKRKRALKPKPLSSRQRKALCLYEIPRTALQRYELYEPLHALWTRYIQEVLGLTVVGGGDEEGGKKRKEKRYVTSTADAAKLCAADFHGAVLEVVRSRCVGRVGIKGIVVKDGRGAFDIVTRSKKKEGGGEVKRVPKEGTWFAFEVPLPETVEGEDDGDVKMEEDAKVDNGEEKEKQAKTLKFELHGDQFIYRAADRANRKFKSHYLKDL